jgi:hypothetical protein
MAIGKPEIPSRSWISSIAMQKLDKFLAACQLPVDITLLYNFDTSLPVWINPHQNIIAIKKFSKFKEKF